jgi:alpha-galactosidase
MRHLLHVKLNLAIAFGLGACSAAAAESVALTTADTAVRVEASASRLRLKSLRTPGAHRDWIAASPQPVTIPLVDTAEVDGRTVPLAWHLIGRRHTGGIDGQCDFTFACTKPSLELHSLWQAAAGPGPVTHTLRIINRSGRTVLLPLQTSLRFGCAAGKDRSLEQWWVEKGGGTPTGQGVHRESVLPGYERALISTPYAEDNRPRDAIPWTAMQDLTGREGWYAGIEFSGRVRLQTRWDSSRHATEPRLVADFGLLPESAGSPAYRTRLAPGETFEAPTVFVGCYQGDVDDGANRLRRWVAARLRPPVADARYPLLTNNSWGSGMAIDDALARRMIGESAELGLEMFHVDAGWFRAVGDWRPDQKKFPHGLAAISDYAHAKGLKFGLWVGWTQGGIQPDGEDRGAILNVFAPDRKDWFTRDYPADWKPADFTGADLCLSDPHAQDWCLSLLDRLVRDYRLDMLEHDQRMIVDSCARADHPHTESRTDIAYRAAQGYYRVYDGLRARRPRLLFEDCVNGGRTVDYGIVRRVHYISITDTYDPLSNRRAFFDASYALPPAMCECYIANHPARNLPEFVAMLRSGMMGWCTLMCDTSKWTAEQHRAAKRQFALYKSRLRPLIVAGDLFHASERPDGVRWDGIEYASPSRRQAVLFAFRGTTSEARHTFPLRGLDPAAHYRVTFEDDAAAPVTRDGAALMRDGLTVDLATPSSSQLVFLQRQTPARRGVSTPNPATSSSARTPRTLVNARATQ